MSFMRRKAALRASCCCAARATAAALHCCTRCPAQLAPHSRVVILLCFPLQAGSKRGRGKGTPRTKGKASENPAGGRRVSCKRRSCTRDKRHVGAEKRIPCDAGEPAGWLRPQREPGRVKSPVAARSWRLALTTRSGVSRTEAIASAAQALSMAAR